MISHVIMSLEVMGTFLTVESVTGLLTILANIIADIDTDTCY